jgi:hypothetical protein
MTPYQLAVKALKTNPERFLEDSCPIENIGCFNCPFKWQSNFPADPKVGYAYTCGIDPEYIKNTGIIDQLKIDYPEYYL